MKIPVLIIFLIIAFSLTSCCQSEKNNISYAENFLLKNNVKEYEIVDDYTIRNKVNQDLFVFSYPIRSKYTNRLINPEFYPNEDKNSGYKAKLYSCEISLPNSIAKNPIQFVSNAGSLDVLIHDETSKQAKKTQIKNIFGEKINAVSYSGAFDGSADLIIYSGNNGIAIEIHIDNLDKVRADSFDFNISTNSNNNFIYENREYYSALMYKKRTPYFLIQSMFSYNSKGIMLNSSSINTFDFKNYTFSIDISKLKAEAKFQNLVIPITFEYYCAKAVFDTVAYSKKENANIVYSSYIFLGNSNEFGEEYLYLRLDNKQFSKLVNSKNIKADLYIKRLNFNNNNNAIFNVLKMDTEWCSFETTWKSKKKPSTFLFDLNNVMCDYYKLNVSSLALNINAYPSKEEAGILIKREEGTKGYQILASADNMFFPYVIHLHSK